MSDAMQVLAVAGALLTVAQVVAALPGGRRDRPASTPVARPEARPGVVPSWSGTPALADARERARSGA